jgi:hypothetical protein
MAVPAQKTTIPQVAPVAKAAAPVAKAAAATAPQGFNASNVMKMPGMEKYAKPAVAKPANFSGGPTGYASVNTTFKQPAVKPAKQPSMAEEKQRLDPKCWKGYKKQGTKMKGDTRVNNCVPVKESAILQGVNQLDEGWKEKLGAAALAGTMALGAAGANARVTPDGQGGYTGGLKPTATQQATDVAPAKAEAPKGFSKEYLQKAADPNRFGRYMISVEKAQELLNQMNEDQLDEKWSKKYKDSINCSNPKGFSQKAHCQGKNK